MIITILYILYFTFQYAETQICSSGLKCEGKCIDNSEICNGIRDCLNGDDEVGCHGLSIFLFRL